MGTGSTDFASPGDRLPYFFSDRQTIDYRRAATLADHFDLHLARAGSLMMQDRWDAADAALAEALAVLPASAELYHLKALVAEERGDAASAVDCASRAVRLIEDRADELLFERRAGKEIAERLRLYRAQRDRLRRAGGPQ